MTDLVFYRDSWEIQPPKCFRVLYPGAIWRLPDKEKTVYLTFDDGPAKEVTPAVIDILNEFNAKATFFCVGNNVKKNPLIYQRLVKEGMKTGNHTFSHTKAFDNTVQKYLKDVDKCSYYVESDLFRPPHGQLYPWHLPALKKRFKNIIMWDVLSKDYDNKLTADGVAHNVIKNVREGSIVVFHDSVKAWPRLKEALPKILKYLTDNNYKTELL
ncbi:polysaccharide deacetylase family protein [Marinilabiliaceae bacterium ANBcel2]|nr:polysaccharide deacetylase family protein [Marinilabiliaceae bacterium ANBcel2]